MTEAKPGDFIALEIIEVHGDDLLVRAHLDRHGQHHQRWIKKSAGLLLQRDYVESEGLLRGAP